MNRPTIHLLAVIVIVATTQATASARNTNWNAVRNQAEKIARASSPVKNWQKSGSRKKNNQGSRNQNQGNQSARKLPKTTKLDGELRETSQALNGLASRVSSIERSVENARKRAQDIEKMIKTLDRLDDKVYRIKRELESLSKIPQLRILRPLVTNLGKVRNKIHSVRVKADQVNKDVVRPLISKLRKAEKKVEAKIAEIRQAKNQTNQARQKLLQLTSYVESRGYKNGEVRALESLAKPVSSSIRPVHQMISQMDRSLGGIDREFNSLAQKLNAISKAKNAVSKLERDLNGADKAARDLGKVMSKKISVKFPVKFSVTIRQLLEAPGKVLDVVLKPLQKLANKALNPVLKKFKVEIKVSGQITSLSGKLANLKSQVNGVGNSISKMERALKKQVPKNYKNQLTKLIKKNASQL